MDLDAILAKRLTWQEAVPFRDFLLDLNGAYTRFSARRLCNGVYRGRNGILHRPGACADVRDKAVSVGRFARWLESRGIAFVYALAPLKGCGQESCPPVFSKGKRVERRLDAFVSALVDNKVRTIDFRQVFTAHGWSREDLFYRTDHHWTGDASFRAFHVLGEEISRLSPTLSPNWSNRKWTREVWPGCFLGSMGRRTGRFFAGLDDLIVYRPLFETHISMVIPEEGICRTGSFEQTCMSRSHEIVRGREGRERAYSLLYSAGVHPLVRFENHAVETPLRVLLIGDSFMWPVEAFLCTVAREVVAVDPRQLEKDMFPLSTFVERVKPDVVIQLQNPSSLGAGGKIGKQPKVCAMFEYGV